MSSAYQECKHFQSQLTRDLNTISAYQYQGTERSHAQSQVTRELNTFSLSLLLPVMNLNTFSFTQFQLTNHGSEHVQFHSVSAYQPWIWTRSVSLSFSLPTMDLNTLRFIFSLPENWTLSFSWLAIWKLSFSLLLILGIWILSVSAFLGSA